ncbi:MAG: hypothetical protein K2X81_06520, partial [Candidatus Obscuribacterales bacterium]|nr:hypothetical protein [Candidatus Obscuribacterales bacterium]
MFTLRPLMQAPQQAETLNTSYKTFADYSELYWESTQETLVGIYAKRDSKSGLPLEDLNGIIHRVAFANAIAELKYALSPQELLDISFDQAINHPSV